MKNIVLLFSLVLLTSAAANSNKYLFATSFESKITHKPEPTKDGFTLGIGPKKVTLRTGTRERNAAFIYVIPRGNFSGRIDASFEISNEALVIDNRLDPHALTVDASNASPGDYTVKLVGVQGKLREEATLKVTVTPEPEGTVHKVTLSPKTATVEAGKTLPLQATIVGEGNFNRECTWEVTESGEAGSDGYVVPDENGAATLHVYAKTQTDKMYVTVRSEQAPGMLDYLEINVLPTTIPIVLKTEKETISFDARLSFGYIGNATGVSLAKPSEYVKYVKLDGQMVEIHSSEKIGTETIFLTFNLASGGTHTVPFTLTVRASKTAPEYRILPASFREPTIEELNMLAYINELRKNGANCGSTYFPPAPPLQWNAKLALAARSHSIDMGKRNYVAHTTPDLQFPNDRALAAGYAWFGVGENLAAGAHSTASVVARWQTSPGHCSTMMNAANIDAGIGIEREPGTRYFTYWTLKTGFGETYKP